MAILRQDLLDQDIIHEFDSALVRRNLRGCYGKLAKMYYEGMLAYIAGKRVLDVGCGFGLFSRVCRDNGFQVHSIDVDEQSLRVAREVFQLDGRLESVYETSLPQDSIDTIVFNDVMCHLEFPKLMRAVDRLGPARLIIFDSNMRNPLLRMYRSWAGHEEFQDYTPAAIIENLERFDFRAQRIVYHNFLSLPISGGLQRDPVPLAHRFPRVIHLGERMLSAVLPWTSLNRFVAFRYLMLFDRARTPALRTVAA